MTKAEDGVSANDVAVQEGSVRAPTKPERETSGVQKGLKGLCMWGKMKGMTVSKDEEEEKPEGDDVEKPTLNTQDTALVAGGQINIWEKKNIGFILQYFAVGIIYGGLPSTIYGLLLGYLNVPGYVYATAGVITVLPWSFKFAFGLMNDCVPILGYRRKPYMVIGWALCAIMLIVISTYSLPPPYYCRDDNGDYITKVKDPVTGDMVPATPCNENASRVGGSYALLMCLAALGYVVADVAADGLMVTYAQREPAETRGQTQTMIYLVRHLGVICAVALVGLCMNGKEYQGTFTWTFSFNQICGILAIPAIVMCPVSWFFVDDEKIVRVTQTERDSIEVNRQISQREVTEMRTSGDGSKPVVDRMTSTMSAGTGLGPATPDGQKVFTLSEYMEQTWDMLSGRISTTAGGYVKKEWAGVQNIQNQMFTLVSCAVFAWGLYQVKKRYLHLSWRMMLFTTTVFLNVTDLIIAGLTIFDVVRNQYFYLGETILDDIPSAANFVVGTFIIVEMADQGNEGLTYGLLTTISNLGSPFARAVGNQIFRTFTPDLSDGTNYVKDDPAFRTVVFKSFILSYFFSFIALTFLFLLPTQKKMAQDRKATWPKSSKYAYITCALVFCALTYSLCVNFMAMFPATMCMKFAGGNGCEPDATTTTTTTPTTTTTM